MSGLVLVVGFDCLHNKLPQDASYYTATDLSDSVLLIVKGDTLVGPLNACVLRKEKFGNDTNEPF